MIIFQIRSSQLLLAILAASVLGIGSIIYLMYITEAIALHSAVVLAVAGGVYAGFGLSAYFYWLYIPNKKGCT